MTAEPLKKRVLEGLASQGVAVLDCGLASTPSMFMATVLDTPHADGSIMLTASHLPYYYNGMKFFTDAGGLESSEIAELLRAAASLEKVQGPAAKAAAFDLISLYAETLCEKVKKGVLADDGEHPLKGLRIAVDAGNGAGGFFARKVLEPLGADITGSQYLEPDGMFPNHIPNPENKEAMESIRDATVRSQADIGIIFDADVDRMSAVLGDGEEICRDAMIAMMAAILAPEVPGGTVVTDSVTSDKLTDFLQNTLGLTHHRFKRGYKNVINEAKRLNAEGIRTPLAIETSGHGAFQENYFLDDGAYMAVKLLIAAARARKDSRKLDELLAKLEKPYESREYRMKLDAEDFKGYGSGVLQKFEERAQAAKYAVDPHSYEGVRLSFHGADVQGWMLLRLSLHEPLLVLNLEGNRPDDLGKLIEIARDLLAGFDRVAQI